MFSVGKHMQVCNLLCDVILSTTSSPAQSVGVGNWVRLKHCVLRILDTFIVHQWLPIKVNMRMVGFLCVNVIHW